MRILKKRTHGPAERGPRGLMANTGSLFISRIIIAALGWAGTILIIRNLSREEWGQFTFVFSFLSLVAVISNVVNSRVAIHGLLGEDAERFAGSYVLLRCLLGLLGYCVSLTFVVLAGYPQIVVQATAVAGVVILIATPSLAYDAVFQAHLQMDRIAVANVVAQLVQFALTAVLAAMGSTLIIFTLPAVVFEIVRLLLKMRWLRSLQTVRYVPDVRRWGGLLRAAIPLAIGGGLATAYYSLDSVMLSKLGTFSAVGTYGIAYKFAGVVQFLPTAMSAALIGFLVRAWPDRPAEFVHILRKAATTLFLIGVLLLVEFGLFATQAIRLLYGDGYASAGNATRLVIAGECLGFFTSLGVTTFAAMSRNVLYPIAALAGLLLNFGLNLVLIPRFSYQGSAWATLMTEVLVVSVLWVPLSRTVGALPVGPSVALKAAAIGAAAGLSGRAALFLVPWIPAALVVAAVFLALLHIARVPDRGGFVALLRSDEVPPVVADVPG